MGATTSTPRPSAGRVRGLDGLRALAALAIVFHHVGFASAATYTAGGWGRYLGRLDIGVPIFFALSGFLLFRPIAAAVMEDRPLRPALVHLWRRALRIYPAFWVALVLIVLLTSEAFVDVTGAVTTFFLVHIHWPTHAIGPVPQSWSLATEVSFYAALPVMARFLRPWLHPRDRAGRRNGLFVFTAVCYLLSVFFRVWVFGLDNRWTSAQLLWLPGTLDYFSIGMTLAVARVGFERDSAPRQRLERAAAPAGWWWLGAAFLFHVVAQRMGLALGVDTASWPREMGRQFVYGAIGLCLLFPLVFGGDRPSLVRSIMRSRPMEWLGTVSYSVYLWHMAFIVHPWEPLADLFGAERNSGSFLWDYAGTNFWTYLVIALVPTMVVAVVSYYAVERSGQRIQGWLSRPVVDRTWLEMRVGRARDRWATASFRAQLAVVASAGFVLRVVYVVVAKRDQTLEAGEIFPGDQFYYSLAADALAKGEGFVTPWQHISRNLGLADAGDVATHAADHPPLTAIVASPASLLPGGRGDHLFEQRLIMCLVGAAVIAVIGLLGREIAGRSVGLVGAGIAALYPGFWINDGLVMAESLTTLMVAGALLGAVRYRRLPSGRGALVLGGWIGLAALARAESLLLVPLLVVPLMWVAHDRWRVRLGRMVGAGLVVAAVIAPWVGPNLVRFDEPVTMSTNDGLTLIGANSPQTYSGSAIGFWTLEYAEGLRPGLPELEGADQSVVSRIWREEAWSFVGDNVDRLPSVVGARLGRLWSVYQPIQMADWNTGEGREEWASNLAIFGFFAVVPLALIGWWQLGRRPEAYRWPLTAMVIHVSVVGALFYGIPRFRVPAEVALVVAAAIGIRWLASLGSCPPPRTSSSPGSSSSPSSSSTHWSASKF